MLRSPPRTHVDAPSYASRKAIDRSAKAALRIRMALGPTPWILRSSVSECSLTFSKLSIPANWSSRGQSFPARSEGRQPGAHQESPCINLSPCLELLTRRPQVRVPRTLPADRSGLI